MNLYVWDFHGTLEEGSELGYTNMLNVVLERNGYQEHISPDLALYLHGKSAREHFGHLFPSAPEDTLSRLVEEANTTFDADPTSFLSTVKPTPHAFEVLDTIRTRGDDMIVISKARPTSIHAYLNHVGMLDYFPEGKALGLLQSGFSTKLEILQDYVQRNSPTGCIIAVGDSPADVVLAAPFNGTSYLFAHHGREFPICSAHFHIRDLRKVLGPKSL